MQVSFDDFELQFFISSLLFIQRENWMNEESFVPTLSKDEMYTSSRQKRIESKKQQQQEEEVCF